MSVEERVRLSPPGSAVPPSSSPGAAPDMLLARSAARGDQSARGELIRRYQERIYQVAYGYVHDRDEALEHDAGQHEGDDPSDPARRARPHGGPC